MNFFHGPCNRTHNRHGMRKCCGKKDMCDQQLRTINVARTVEGSEYEFDSIASSKLGPYMHAWADEADRIG